MKIKLIIQREDTGQELWRRYDWEADGDQLFKGEEIEEMIARLSDDSKPPF